MSNPTHNKWKSTNIYGKFAVRDLTNSAGNTVIELAETDLSGNLIVRGDATFSKAVMCDCNVADINANNVLTTKQYVDSAVSTGGSVSLSGANNFSGFNTYNTNFPTSTLPTSTTITTDSIVNKGMLDTIYQTISGMSSYLTTATASTTYQTIANMTNYLTTATASTTYQAIVDMTNYLTTATASTTYQTLAGMSSYLTTSAASTTYSTLANQVKTNTANAFTSTNTFNTNLPTSTLTPSTSTQLTTKAYVDSVASGYATLAGTQTFTGVNTFRDALINTGLPKGNYIELDPYFIKVDDSNVVTNNKNIYIEPEGLTLTNSIITQTGSIADTMTNSMVNLQVSTMSFKYEIFTTSTKDYSSLKMPSYIFENRTSGATCNLTLSTDDYLDNGQHFYLKRIGAFASGEFSYTNNVNITAGAGTTILRYNNSSTSTDTPLPSVGSLSVSYIYDKPNLRWIQITLPS
jgi:hypothetical protein